MPTKHAPPIRRAAACRASVALAAATCTLALVGMPAASQDSDASGTHQVLATLHGTWEGSGLLLGRPGTFHMAWDVTEGPFVRLSYANAWVDQDGGSMPVLSAEATYFLRDGSVVGVWVDDRPQRLTLAGVVTDSSLVVEWTAELEDGRTEYVVRSADTVFVRDFVSTAGVERPFAEALYHRRVALPSANLVPLGPGLHEEPIVTDHPEHLALAVQPVLAEHLPGRNPAVLGDLLQHVLHEARVRRHFVSLPCLSPRHRSQHPSKST